MNFPLMNHVVIQKIERLLQKMSTIRILNPPLTFMVDCNSPSFTLCHTVWFRTISNFRVTDPGFIIASAVDPRQKGFGPLTVLS